MSRKDYSHKQVRLNDRIIPVKSQDTGWVSRQICVQAARTCNLYCAYCHNPPKGETEPLAPVLARIRREKINAVSLEGGGEPTVNPKLFDIAARLRAAGVRHFMLSTNAVALSDPELCARAAAEMDFFTVNFPSHLPDEYAAATRSVKYRLAVKGLMNLKACGAESRIRLFHIISSFNFKRLPEFAGWTLKELPGAAFVNFTFVRGYGRAARARGVMPRYSETEPYLKLALAKLKLGRMKAVVQNFPLCRLEGFEGFSFELQRGLRGDAVFEEGVAAMKPCAACRACTLSGLCCGARADYAKAHGLRELKASRKDPASIKPERF